MADYRDDGAPIDYAVKGANQQPSKKFTEVVTVAEDADSIVPLGYECAMPHLVNKPS